jgi:hypothetical protein
MMVMMMVSVCLSADLLLLLMLFFPVIDRWALGETTHLIKLWTDVVSLFNPQNVGQCVYRCIVAIVMNVNDSLLINTTSSKTNR